MKPITFLITESVQYRVTLDPKDPKFEWLQDCEKDADRIDAVTDECYEADSYVRAAYRRAADVIEGWMDVELHEDSKTDSRKVRNVVTSL